MKRSFLILSLLFGLLALTVAWGCGDGQQQTGTTATTSAANAGAGYACNKNGPSIIPKPSGKPQLVEFFRDT